MKFALAVFLSCAVVVALGAGIETVPSAEARVATTPVAEASAAPVAAAPAIVHAAPRAGSLRVMPTVYVTADVSDYEDVDADLSAGLEDAVDHARVAVVGGAARSAQRLGLAVPYFAFSQAGAAAD